MLFLLEHLRQRYIHVACINFVYSPSYSFANFACMQATPINSLEMGNMALSLVEHDIVHVPEHSLGLNNDDNEVMGVCISEDRNMVYSQC